MMSETIQLKEAGQRCPICGSVLPRGLAMDSCPKCLLEAGLATQVGVTASAPPRLRDLPRPGEQFGHYQIVRLLGQGGMGAVFEAQDLSNQRRVALKFLIGALDFPESRARFLREGQIAASINHPNSVYVFGTEEIAGVPVIAMELMGGGTLAERVHREGPLAPAAAADAMLQVIAGLEAAARAGLLHRDVKPSNCFIDSDGTVKIGDFGLSIDTNIRAEAGPAGGLFGTPAFSSPEQLRGEALTVRSDIYAVGATLYYLLTGRPPFEGSDLAQVLPRVMTEKVESPAKWKPGIPPKLCRVALRCLDKFAGERFADYAGLRKALLPCVSIPSVPAALGVRFVAGCIDIFLIVSTAFFLSSFRAAQDWRSTFVFYGMVVAYFAVPEALTGKTPGKALFGLHAARADGGPIGWPRAVGRSITFVGLVLFCTDLIAIVMSGGNDKNLPNGLIGLSVIFMLLGLAFSTARRKNGFAALQDVLTGTRVLSKSQPRTRLNSSQPFEVTPAGGKPQQIGPYQILAELGDGLLLGFDPRLLRQVWIRRAPPGSDAVPSEFRNLARPTRLRWLNGFRSATEAWDAYEAPSGQPLVRFVSNKQEWAAYRHWLFDVARELEIAAADGTMPATLGLRQIWITESGVAKLLDFPAPGTSPRPNAAGPREFLREIALFDGLAQPIPSHAREFIESLDTASPIGARLEPLLARKATVTRGRRLGLLACGLWFPLFLTIAAMLLNSGEKLGLLREPKGPLLLAWAYGSFVVMGPGLLAALLFKGGAILRAFGVAIVRRDGRPASRVRIFWRACLSYAPFFILPPVAWPFGIHARWEWLMFLLLAILAGLALVSTLLPGRSLQDRLAGTWLVAR